MASATTVITAAVGPRAAAAIISPARRLMVGGACSNGRPSRDKCPAGAVCASGYGPKSSHGGRGWAYLTALATALLVTHTIAA